MARFGSEVYHIAPERVLCFPVAFRCPFILEVVRGKCNIVIV